MALILTHKVGEGARITAGDRRIDVTVCRIYLRDQIVTLRVRDSYSPDIMSINMQRDKVYSLTDFLTVSFGGKRAAEPKQVRIYYDAPRDVLIGRI